MQLSNSQKVAERQSCYSGPKENLIEDRQRRRKWPTKKSEGKLHRTKPWERRNQLGSTTKIKCQQKKTTKGYALSLKRQKWSDWRNQTSTNQKDDKKRKCWHFKLSAKEEKTMKGYALSLKGTKYDRHNQYKCQSTWDKKKKEKALASSSTNINQRNHVPIRQEVWSVLSKPALIKRTMKGYALPSKGRSVLGWTTRAEKIILRL